MLPRICSAISSANASPAEGPPTLPMSISTSTGSSMSADWSTWTPTIGRPFSSGLSIVPTSTVRVFSPERTPSRTVSPGSCSAIRRRRSSGVRTGAPSTATITSVGTSLPAAGVSLPTAATSAPSGSASTS